jgi:ATP-dependent DNA ligase
MAGMSRSTTRAALAFPAISQRLLHRRSRTRVTLVVFDPLGLDGESMFLSGGVA